MFDLPVGCPWLIKNNNKYSHKFRRRRIKCDETKPTCQRCIKSVYHCQGYHDSHNNITAIQPRLTGPNDRTCSILLYFLDFTHPGYGLHSWRPNLLVQLPQRIGCSEVFDTSVATFTSLLGTLHLPSSFQKPTRKSRELYISSVKGLQKALATPKERYHASTMYSAYILSQCHVWMDQSSTITRGHGEGITHLVHVVLAQKPKDEFLITLCYAMVAEVVRTM